MSFIKKKKLVDQKKLGNELKDKIEANEAQSKGQMGKGLNCGNIAEPIPKYEKAPCEKVIKNRNNGTKRKYGTYNRSNWKLSI